VHNDEKYLKSKMTLGPIIDCYKCSLKMLDKNKSRDELSGRLLNDNYINSFIQACKQINELRNTLFHNLFKDYNISLKNVIRNFKT